jgi:hypothetical protein
MSDNHVHDYRITFTETADGEVWIESQMTVIPRYLFMCTCGDTAWKNPYAAAELGLAHIAKVVRKMTPTERENRKTTIAD